MAQNNLGGYKSYAVKDHDIILDKLSRLYEVAGFRKANGYPDLKRVERLSGVTLGTLSNWENRKVRRPQHAGIMAVVNALGGRYELTFKGDRILAGTIVTRNDVIAKRVALKKARAAKKKRKAA